MIAGSSRHEKDSLDDEVTSLGSFGNQIHSAFLHFCSVDRCGEIESWNYLGILGGGGGEGKKATPSPPPFSPVDSSRTLRPLEHNVHVTRLNFCPFL